MFYDITKAVEACLLDNYKIFDVIDFDYKEVYEVVIDNRNFDFNIVDNDGNNVLMKLLKHKDYDLVLKYIGNYNIDINHQNKDGNTFAHLLVGIKSYNISLILDKLLNKRSFDPNVRNNNNHTILDVAINSDYFYTIIKILSDRRFSDINLYSFKKLVIKYIKNKDYGIYSKINNFSLIINNLEKKSLLPSMDTLVKLINKNINLIESDFNNNDTSSLDTIIDFVSENTI